MKNKYLYAGKILWVDLSKRKFWTIPTETYSGKFLGGRGVGIRILWEESSLPSIDPLGPQNALIFSSGPLTGTMVPGSGRCSIIGKSPLTGLIALSSFGGSFAPELKYAGYDHLVVIGQSSEPVYISIENEEVKIRSASNVWGLNPYETHKALCKELNDEEIKWVCIGPAGERLVLFSNIASEMRDSNRQAGLGAVMGSKKLKAITVKGTGGIKIAEPEVFFESCAKVLESLKSNHPDHILSIQSLRRGEGESKRSCFGCPMACEEEFHGFMLGASLFDEKGIGDRIIWPELATVIIKYGFEMDYLLRMLKWVMGLFEQGILDEKEIGFQLRLEERETILKLVEIIAKREGLGDILAGGLLRASQEIGRSSEQFISRSLNSKNGKAQLQYYGLFGEVMEGTHLTFPSDDIEKAEVLVYAEDAMEKAEILGSCKWLTEFNGLPLTEDIQANLLSIGLGKEMSTRELSIYQKRVHQLERAFNCRQGIRREFDSLADHYFTDSTAVEHQKGFKIDRKNFEALKDRYYKLRGWDLATGIPIRATLDALGLGDVADILEKSRPWS